ncbi:enoyl-CoA hydratase-related protein [Sphingosinicella sp. LHD-64]|uniref:enoyl-CoA hydratase/isomerase family protein n=1 Tax=Sphingosinicella sp. LHD-64 TaxID=3072139 RepID=UPI00280D216C|nr:enoyl-CoA hydratase-related protein [Sphingosinicella sp. LHD-64]MDQ8757612.1 enoyl-CoA hydratase-related protein [Sphingosinicella sp. LHD-64]
MYEGYETLKVVRHGGVVTVSFNRPEVKNATNARMHQELMRIFPEIGRDPEARVAILTGEGDCFSAGGDIKGMQKMLDDQARWIESMTEARDIVLGVVDLDIPVIAKVNGHAIGLGATLALFCDIVIAKDTAKIADPHVKVGLVAGDGGSVIWPALIGYAKAKRYLLTGDPITGAEAAEIGLVTEACPAGELDARVDTIAQQLAAGAAVAIRLTKRAVNMALRQQIDALIEAHLGFETLSHLSADHREAVNAFAEGRTPAFTGR